MYQKWMKEYNEKVFSKEKCVNKGDVNMSFAMSGLTHCIVCGSPLKMNESVVCRSCEEKERQEEKILKEIKTSTKKESIKTDMENLQKAIQKFTNKWDMEVEIYYEGKKAHLSVKLKV